jgi:hypothetical protein
MLGLAWRRSVLDSKEPDLRYAADLRADLKRLQRDS